MTFELTTTIESYQIYTIFLFLFGPLVVIVVNFWWGERE